MGQNLVQNHKKTTTKTKRVSDYLAPFNARFPIRYTTATGPLSATVSNQTTELIIAIAAKFTDNHAFESITVIFKEPCIGYNWKVSRAPNILQPHVFAI